MYGTQTTDSYSNPHCQFENDVKMYGTQTSTMQPVRLQWFENDVKMYGTQTRDRLWTILNSLRMM